MKKMLYEVMQHCKNFFPKKYFEGTFEVKDGLLRLPEETACRYMLVEGSALSDGVWYIYDTLEDEVFTGVVTLLAPPKSFLDLVKDIEEWRTSNEPGTLTPYASESFGGYSYTRATNGSGKAVSWHDVFSSRLKIWRML